MGEDVGSLRLWKAKGCDECDWCVTKLAKEEGEQAGSASICPVKIVEKDDSSIIRDKLAKKSRECFEELKLSSIGIRWCANAGRREDLGKER